MSDIANMVGAQCEQEGAEHTALGGGGWGASLLNIGVW